MRVSLIFWGVLIASLGSWGSGILALEPSKSVTQYSLISWQEDSGLPQDTVRAVTQTPDGYLWVATEAGLARFDGVRMDVFNRRTHPRIFRNSHIYALAVSDRGDLWIGTYGGGLVRYRGGRFESVPVPGLASGRVTSLLTVGEDLWIGTYGSGLKLLREGRVETYGAELGLSHPVIFDVAAGARGAVWVATYGGGVNRFSDGRFEVFDESSGLLDDNVWAVLETAAGGLWVGTNSGLQWFPRGLDSASSNMPSRVYTSEEGLSHNRMLSLLLDRDDNLWIGTYGGGLNRFRDGAFQTLDRRQGLSSSQVWSLFEDREGNLWLGTLGGGLVQIKDGPFTTISRPEGLASELPSSFFEDSDGSLWIASRNAGLDRLTADGFERWSTENGLSSDNLWAVLKDSRGDLWVATSGDGVDLRRDGRWLNLDTNDGLAGSTVFVISEDRSGSVWLGTNAGLNRYRDGEISLFTAEDGLASNQIRSLSESRDGRLWVGTAAGLSVADPGEGSFLVVDGLQGIGIQHVVEDRQQAGLMWIATAGEGLIRLQGDQIEGFTTEEGFFDDLIRVVVEDDLGFLWLAGSQGISRVGKDVLSSGDTGFNGTGTLPHLRFGQRDGMKSSACYGGHPSALRTRDGRIWFATLDGVTVVDPADLKSAPAPKVLVEGLWVDNRPVADPSSLPADGRAYQFSFTALTLSVPEKIGIRFRLVGLEDTWREAGKSREARYGRLPAGDYVFEVIAGDELGRWTGEVTRFPITVLPAFHQTTAFWVLCLLALAASGFFLHALRVARLRRRERILNERVEEALANLNHLQGMLPICGSCKKIRSDEGYWEQIETYIDQHTDASFSHGMCPSCAQDLFPDLDIPSGDSGSIPAEELQSQT